jgi:hypothetical protein
LLQRKLKAAAMTAVGQKPPRRLKLTASALPPKAATTANDLRVR